MIRKLLTIPMLAALLAGAGAIATTSAPAAAQYAPYGYAPNARQNVVTGVVTYFYRFDMTIQAPNGAVIPVQLHQGTIINPLGVSLQPGMPVTVRGYWANGQFFANRIRLR
jgi:hypothetical protein